MPDSNLILERIIGHIIVHPDLLTCREKGEIVRKLISRKFNIDTACIELRMELDGTLELCLRKTEETHW